MSKTEAGIKLVISDPKLGKSLQKEVPEEKIRSLIGMKIESIKWSSIASFVNGKAGELVVAELNGNHLVATDLLEYIPDAFNTE